MASLVKGGSQQYGEISRSDKGGLLPSGAVTTDNVGIIRLP